MLTSGKRAGGFHKMVNFLATATLNGTDDSGLLCHVAPVITAQRGSQ